MFYKLDVSISNSCKHFKILCSFIKLYFAHGGVSMYTILSRSEHHKTEPNHNAKGLLQIVLLIPLEI